MFTVMGATTVVIGLMTLIFVADTPMTARFLTKSEKAALLQHISINRTGVSNKRFVPSQITELLMDIQIWWLAAIIVMVRPTHVGAVNEEERRD